MLRARLAVLEKAFLPPAQDPFGAYPAEQVERTEGYLVLAHAAFEGSVEGACRGAVKKALATLTSPAPSFAAISIMSFFDPGAAIFPEKWSVANPAQKDALAWRARAEKSFKAYEQTITDNNGIKQSNLLRLLLPIGIDVSTLSPAMLIECDVFGSARGNLAHGKVQQVVDPFAEKAKVDQLEAFFVFLDNLISALT